MLAAAIAAFGGVVYWAPKILGRLVPEGGARLVAVLLLVGTVVWSLPDLVSGFLGQPGFPGTVAPDNTDTIEAAQHRVGDRRRHPRRSAARRSCCSCSPRSARRSSPGDDPWSGHTLEWATSSPPPAGNFASLPEITSEAPLYDARRRPRRPRPDGHAPPPSARSPPLRRPSPAARGSCSIGSAFGAVASALVVLSTLAVYLQVRDDFLDSGGTGGVPDDFVLPLTPGRHGHGHARSCRW